MLPYGPGRCSSWIAIMGGIGWQRMASGLLPLAALHQQIRAATLTYYDINSSREHTELKEGGLVGVSKAGLVVSAPPRRGKGPCRLVSGWPPVRRLGPSMSPHATGPSMSSPRRRKRSPEADLPRPPGIASALAIEGRCPSPCRLRCSARGPALNHRGASPRPSALDASRSIQTWPCTGPAAAREGRVPRPRPCTQAPRVPAPRVPPN